MKYSIIGGDLRNIYIYHILKDEGNAVKIGGFEDYPSVESIRNIDELIGGVDVIVGPTPCLGVSRSLNCPHNKEIISFEALIDKMNETQIFISGRIPKDKLLYAQSKNIRCFDLLEREEMSILNAIPTAEGAILIAIEKSKITLFDSNIMVMGFGRVGKILCKMLHGLGAKVYVLTRKASEQTYAKAYGYNILDFDGFEESLSMMDTIINTIPFILLDEKNLTYIKKDCVLIELASKPFGIDAQFCRDNNLNLIFAPSLPGKVAPMSAARYIVETMKNIINDL